MQKKLIAAFALTLLLGLIFLTGTIFSGMDCAGVSHWSATSPPVNQKHVFCGEWNERKNRPVGFHSRPAGENPSTIGTIEITQQPNPQGIYGIRWSYAGHPDRQKFSTMFPDTCDRDQILNSIVYAVEHPKPCPQGSPHWAKCGPNKPLHGGHQYCEAADNSIFTIAFATLGNSNNVNTAFPLVE